MSDHQLDTSVQGDDTKFDVKSANDSTTHAEDRLKTKKSDDSSRTSSGNQKRGKKPRSQRNRKRARSALYSNDDLVYKTEVRQLMVGSSAATPPQWIRIVQPYPFTFCTYAKARWIGRTVLDVYHSEFGWYPKSYYETAILQGRILVSDQTVDLSYCIRGHDVLTHTVHRHEPAVAVSSSEGGVDVIAETKDLVVVDKPGTLPVHACGGYHHNSLLCILESKFGKLYNIHRLDRLTSGLVVVGKTSAVAQQWGRCLLQRDSCEKLYLARVKGRFPLHCPVHLENVTAKLRGGARCVYGEWQADGDPQATDSKDSKVCPKSAKEMRSANALGYWITDTAAGLRAGQTLEELSQSQYSLNDWLSELRGSNVSNTKPPSTERASKCMYWLHLACPTRVAQPKDGICEAGSFDDLDDALYEKTVKASQTSFAIVRYDVDTDSTVLMCRPVTGRTHQIRLHLQYLGHPIANDPNYGGSMWYGDPDGEKACQFAQSKLDAMNRASADQVERLGEESGRIPAEIQPMGSTVTDMPATEEELACVARVKRLENEPLEDFILKTCVWCARSRGGGSDRTMLEFLIRSRGIWLHALQYSIVDTQGGKICFRTEPPSWC